MFCSVSPVPSGDQSWLGGAAMLCSISPVPLPDSVIAGWSGHVLFRQSCPPVHNYGGGAAGRSRRITNVLFGGGHMAGSPDIPNVLYACSPDPKYPLQGEGHMAGLARSQMSCREDGTHGWVPLVRRIPNISCRGGAHGWARQIQWWTKCPPPHDHTSLLWGRGGGRLRLFGGGVTPVCNEPVRIAVHSPPPTAQNPPAVGGGTVHHWPDPKCLGGGA